jgi:hypothetical protein
LGKWPPSYSAGVLTSTIVALFTVVIVLFFAKFGWCREGFGD